MNQNSVEIVDGQPRSPQVWWPNIWAKQFWDSQIDSGRSPVCRVYIEYPSSAKWIFSNNRYSYGILNPKQFRTSEAYITTSCTTKKALSVSISWRKRCRRTKNAKKKAKTQEKASLENSNICEIKQHKTTTSTSERKKTEARSVTTTYETANHSSRLGQLETH